MRVCDHDRCVLVRAVTTCLCAVLRDSMPVQGLEENLPARVRSVHMGSRDSTGDLSAYPRLSRLLTDHPLPFLS